LVMSCYVRKEQEMRRRSLPLPSEVRIIINMSAHGTHFQNIITVRRLS
jgi:hypothetical protein